jgi:hypothetical protein
MRLTLFFKPEGSPWANACLAWVYNGMEYLRLEQVDAFMFDGLADPHISIP